MLALNIRIYTIHLSNYLAILIKKGSVVSNKSLMLRFQLI